MPTYFQPVPPTYTPLNRVNIVDNPLPNGIAANNLLPHPIPSGVRLPTGLEHGVAPTFQQNR